MCSELCLVLQAYRFELDPNQAQRALMAKSVGARRYVYNWGLAESRREYEITGKRPRLRELQKRLVGLKQGEASWLYEVSAHIGQQALVDLERAFDRFFRGLKNEGPKSGYPRFKRKGERDAARLYEVTLEERHLRLPMIGRVRLKQTSSARCLDGRVVSATIRRRADRWFVSLCVERTRAVAFARPVRKRSDVVGVDLGLKAAAVIHNGSGATVVEPHQALRKNLVKLRRLNRQFARKQKGSANREKAKLDLSRLHYRIACQRENFLHQLSTSLAKTKPVIVLEDLHIRGMVSNRHLALSLSDAGMGELRRQLTYKSEWYGATLIIVDRFFPSSKLCSSCGVIKTTLKLAERQFNCNACGVSLDRDVNAALNLWTYGQNKLGIGPLPVDRRKVTPGGEEGSGSSTTGAKPSSLKQEATAHATRRASRRSTPKDVFVRI